MEFLKFDDKNSAYTITTKTTNTKIQIQTTQKEQSCD